MINILILSTFLCLARLENDEFRRAELIVSGFKDSNVGANINNDRKVEVTVNGMIVHVKTLEKDPNYANDEFIYHDAAYEYDPQVIANGYFPRNETLSSLLFFGPVNMTVRYYIEQNGGTTEIEKVYIRQDIRCANNADWVRTYRSDKIEFDYYISYWCRGFTGKGCQYRCDDRSSSKYECFYDNGNQICKDPKFNNPPDCDQFLYTCANNPCQNSGTCFHVQPAEPYCQCPSGWTGQFCEIFVCDPICDPDYGTCTGPNNCTCQPGRGGRQCELNSCTDGYCLHNGLCFPLDNDILCNCDPNNFGGIRCEHACVPSCIFGDCIELDGNGQCQCFEGFRGTSCNETIPVPAPIFEKGYVSARNQKLYYILVTIGLLLVTIILIGVATYVRNKRKTEIKIIKGTQAAVSTLQNTLSRNANTNRDGLSGIQAGQL